MTQQTHPCQPLRHLKVCFLTDITVKGLFLIVHQIKVMIQNFGFSMTDCGLTVMPSEVYVKYGDSVSINCSTTSKDPALMNWEFAVGKTSGTPPRVTWMIEKLEDFTVEPFCFVTLDTDEQCKMKPNITLYSEYSPRLLLLTVLTWKLFHTVVEIL